MPSTNQCIGSHYDELKQRVFYFNYNNNGYNGIYIYDMKSNAITPLLISYVDSAEDLFDFDPKYPIASVNIIYRPDAEGDILLWTDRLNRPMKLNILEATVSGKTYGTAWKKAYLTVARKMPLIAPLSTYQNAIDSAGVPIKINNLKNKLFQFSYRWVYKDNTKSCWSPWGKMSSPYSVDALSIESDPTKNNAIDSVIYTGPIDCSKIEISARETVANAFSDRMIVTTLDKTSLALSSDATYTYRFFNDSAYPFSDDIDPNQLFDYVPKKANAQELLNGNTIIYGGITEGNTYSGNLDMATTVVSVANGAGGTEIPMTISSYSSGRSYSYVFYGTPLTGDYVKLNFIITPDGSYPTYRYVEHTVTAGETFTQIIDDLQAKVVALGYTAIDITSSGNPGVTIGSSVGTDTITGSYTINYASTPSPTEINNAVYKSSSRYHFGIAYFDEYGVTSGVVTKDALKLTMPETASTSIGTVPFYIPQLTFKINSTPPSWAKYYSFVRTNNTTISEFKMMTTDQAAQDGTYGYLDISSYNKNTSGYPVYTHTKGDRIRIYGRSGTTFASVLDLPILEMVETRPVGSFTNLTGYFLKMQYDVANMSLWGTVGYNVYFIELYTPAIGSIDTASQVFYEFGETYNIITDANGASAHEGQTSNQVVGTNGLIALPTAPVASLVASAGNLGVGKYSYKVEFVTSIGNSMPSDASNVITTIAGSTQISLASIPLGPTGVSYTTTARKIYRTLVGGSTYKLVGTISNNTATTFTDNIADGSLTTLMPQPATFVFSKGDVYTRNRGGLYVIDKSVSDKYDSKISNIGRSLVIDDYSKETYFPTTIRYSYQYQQNTNINETNKFLYDKVDDYDRERGDIQRLKTRGRTLKVFQNRACGAVPILQNVMQTADGTNVIAQSGEILNKIQYYQGDYGIGNQYCSLAFSAQAEYFTDPILGCQVRLSNDGMTSITETYKAHFYFTDKIAKYQKTFIDTFGNSGNAKVLGVYDAFEEEFITAMQAGTIASPAETIPAYTFSFSETRNAYSSFYDYSPEWMECAGNVIITWKSGELWVHNNTNLYANFYGEQKTPSIKVIFNDNQNIKKHYNTITTLGNTTWVAPTTGNINTNMGQVSQLIQSDFKVKDDKYHASFKRDVNSTGGIYNGKVLKGSWIEITFSPVNPQNLVDLYYMELGILQPLNNR
jgi:hypothetical protein